jgi:hypothetical protein
MRMKTKVRMREGKEGRNRLNKFRIGFQGKTKEEDFRIKMVIILMILLTKWKKGMKI